MLAKLAALLATVAASRAAKAAVAAAPYALQALPAVALGALIAAGWPRGDEPSHAYHLLIAANALVVGVQATLASQKLFGPIAGK